MPTTADATLRNHIDQIPEAASLKELRLAALERYERAEKPAPSDESWRKVKLDVVDPRGFDLTGSESILNFRVPEEHAGLRILSFAEAAAGELKDVVEARLRRDLEEAHDIFALQNLALYSDSVLIHAARPLAQPVLLHRKLQRGDACLPRTLIVAEQSADVTVVETFEGLPGDDPDFLTYWNPQICVESGPNARVRYVAVYRYAGNEYYFHRFTADQQADSQVHVSVADLGGWLGKSFYTSRIHQRGARFRGIGVAAGAGREFMDMEMYVEHHADHTSSSLLYKTVMRDRAHSVFNGNLLIDKERKHVDSYQTNNNILLSPKARAESMPKLVIHAEDVACEHGATVGELDREALFFLMARGLPESEARSLLIEAFLQQVLEEFPVEELREPILENIRQRLAL